MTIPFLDYFKKAKEKVAAKQTGSVAVAPLPPIEKPKSERFSKTVMPNVTRTSASQDMFQAAARSSAMGGPIASETAVAPPSPSALPRTISFGDNPMPPKRQNLPPAVALALEPKVERVISLNVSDVVSAIPAGYVKQLENGDGGRRILLKASEVERGMANSRPTVSLASIYQQVPEIFLREVSPNDASQVVLPFAAVLEQFAALQVRPDQERPNSVPQVPTPFLKVTLEDDERFGTKTEELQATDLPPVRVEPPTAEAFAAAEPEPAAPEVAITRPNESKLGAPGSKPAPGPTRIPFKLSPNGTDVSATESVPASAVPSVPNSSAGAQAPTRIPFKMTAPSDDLRPKSEPWLTAESMAAASQTPQATGTPIAVAGETKIALSLAPILRGLPPVQSQGDIGSVSADAKIELPFALIEPQLSLGRIAIPPSVFQAALPEQYRHLFTIGDAKLNVSLPLQDVLKNLPTSSLRMREDQEEQEAGSKFATPFSAKAEEDAKRFNVSGAPVAKPVVVAGVADPGLDQMKELRPATAATEDRPIRNPLQVALDTDDRLDAKGVVARINKMQGLTGCAIMFGDGLSLAGTLPPEFKTEGLCAMAPALLQRVENHIVETKLGALRGMTLSCAKAAVTFFFHENLCLAALHANGDLTAEVREKLSRIVHELSRIYSHPV